ncbi:MAG: hypothetical protein V1808_00405 [Candidatus Daviesbacteria bacterium]
MTDKDFLKMKKLITGSEDGIVKEVGKFVNDILLPQLEEKADKNDMEKLGSRLDSIDRKLDRSLDKDIEQDQRLSKIESVPAVAHELKLKK